MLAVAQLLSTVIWLFTWVLIVQVVMSWLIAFNVVNTRNRFVYQVADITYKLTEPLLQFAKNLLFEYVFLR